MNQDFYFLEKNNKTSNDIIILGQCPSTKTASYKNGTVPRLKKWLDEVGIKEWDFHNVIPEKVNSNNIKDVDRDKLLKAVDGKKIIIALGGFVERACKKYSIDSYKIDHPSPRNRNLNSKEYEHNMLLNLKEHLSNV
jgi:hypothetical protein